ncbi:hypothetical protein RF55_3430 [Lasius niger]|uniref:Uncharacterized protein n=1 Tax=Lasius niger TaxID=67767 RepID=A0A0J7L1D3_LASNI|nr:hypothetical protein RF55_3430 [Lasius niger]
MHRDGDGDGDGDDDTIWSFAPEACDNITATCYVLHGRRHAWELLTPTQKNATTDTSWEAGGVCTRVKAKEWLVGGSGMRV